MDPSSFCLTLWCSRCYRMPIMFFLKIKNISFWSFDTWCQHHNFVILYLCMFFFLISKSDSLYKHISESNDEFSWVMNWKDFCSYFKIKGSLNMHFISLKSK